MSDNDYIYDVFLSFPHDPKWVRWVTNIFEPLLREELTDEIGNRSAQIYVAKNVMSGGDTWPIELAQCHARSRTMFALCTNTYRYKDWCQIEFSMMRAREETYGFRTPDNPNFLLVPGIGQDCEDSPDFLSGIEPIDLKSHAFPEMPERSLEMCELRKQIQAIAASLAKGIRSCPSFDPTWETMTCSHFLDLFKKQNPLASLTSPPRMDGK
jgi:hypothetical protein